MDFSPSQTSLDPLLTCWSAEAEAVAGEAYSARGVSQKRPVAASSMRWEIILRCICWAVRKKPELLLALSSSAYVCSQKYCGWPVRKVTGEITRNTLETCKLVLSLSKCLIPQLLNKHRHNPLFEVLAPTCYVISCSGRPNPSVPLLHIWRCLYWLWFKTAYHPSSLACCRFHIAAMAIQGFYLCFRSYSPFPLNTWEHLPEITSRSCSTWEEASQKRLVWWGVTDTRHEHSVRQDCKECAPFLL